MVSSQVMASESITQLLEDDISFMDFIRDTMELFRRSERPFIICSNNGISPMLFKKDNNGIWIAFLSELQRI